MRKLLRRVLLLGLIGFIVLNLLAFKQAHSMMHFTDSLGLEKGAGELYGAEKWKVLLLGMKVERPQHYRTPKNLRMPFETVFVDTKDGERLEVWHIHPSTTHGQQGSIILFHGYSVSKESLLLEANAFYNWGYHVWVASFRGSDGSSGNKTSIGYHESEDVRAVTTWVMDHYGEENVILFGQSMGAAAILRALSKTDLPVKGIILEAIFDGLLPAIRNRFKIMNVPSFPSAELMVFWGGLQQSFLGFSHNPVDYAAKVEVPALVFHGAEDVHATEAQARRVFTALPGQKTWYLFEDTVHESYVGAEPEVWKEQIRSFLKDL